MDFKLQIAGENSVIVYFVDEPLGQALVHKIRFFCEQIIAIQSNKILQIVPAYSSVLISYKIQPQNHSIIDKIESLAQHCCNTNENLSTKAKKHTLPAYYHPEVALDLETIAQKKRLDSQQIIDRHSKQIYTVYAVGFCPNFAYLGEVDKSIALERLDNPRLKIPAGSVAIANQQTAVYPTESPGGWNIIANCPINLSILSSNKKGEIVFAIADQVVFEPINRQTFLQLGGVIK